MTMIKTLTKLTLSTLCVASLLATTADVANAQCTTCTATLPTTIPLDTIFLDEFPNAVKGMPYNEVANFRFPFTVSGLGDFAPAGTPNISLSAFVITGVTGLPLGLTWTGDRATPMRYNTTTPTTRDGCITLCGTPLQAGTFTINVSLSVETGILAPQAQNIPITFVVEPNPNAVTTFSMVNSVGCGPLEVEMINETTPATPTEIWTYEWDFGNGETSTDRDPAPVTYDSIGNYTVSMRAISRLPIPRTYLNAVTVTGVGCADNGVIGIGGSAVDLFLTLSSSNGTDTITPFQQNQNPPVVFSFGTTRALMPNTVYSINIQDDDAITNGIPGPEDCGTVTFNSDTLANAGRNFTLTLTSGALSLNASITRDTLYETDTLYSEDIVVVDCLVDAVTEYQLNQVKMQVYPNPTNGNVNLEFDLSAITEENISLVITDVLGRTLQSQDLSHLIGSARKETISLSQYGTGVYFMQMQIGNQQITKKVVVLP